MTQSDIRPGVFAVGDRYQIFVPLSVTAVMWVKIGNETYYDDACGILRSFTWLHKVEVPMKALDEAQSYTVVCCEIKERKAYYTTGEEPVEATFAFHPVTGDVVRLYHISDTHNNVELPIRVGTEKADRIDALILNGDVPEDCGKTENLRVVYEIAYGITKGEKPCVFARGNHDNRGAYAEEFARFTPGDNGLTYYTFRLGSLWGLVLDCGEDKADGSVEYGPTTCFHAYRLKETAFLEKLIGRAAAEYDAPEVLHKIVVCHVPFYHREKPPFNIEEDIYMHWARLIGEKIKPDAIFCGHTHVHAVYHPGDFIDSYGLLTCPLIIGSGRKYNEKIYTGGLFTFDKGEPEAEFNSAQGERL